jgi:molybdopterin synthase sulfur carrier subunit
LADVHLPSVLRPMFADLPRHVDVEAPTVLEAIAELDPRWPGLRDRLCAEGPSLRRHIHVYIDGERADLATPVPANARLEVIAAISGG